jgi:hypothetical protein
VACREHRSQSGAALRVRPEAESCGLSSSSGARNWARQGRCDKGKEAEGLGSLSKTCLRDFLECGQSGVKRRFDRRNSGLHACPQLFTGCVPRVRCHIFYAAVWEHFQPRLLHASLILGRRGVAPPNVSFRRRLKPSVFDTEPLELFEDRIHRLCSGLADGIAQGTSRLIATADNSDQKQMLRAVT